MQSLNLACADHYFHSIYILSGVTSSLEMIENIWKAPHRLCANTAPFYKGLENLQIFVSVGGGGPGTKPYPPPTYQGTTVFLRNLQVTVMWLIL